MSQRYGIYHCTTDRLVEGGFFGRDNAELACTEWNREAREAGLTDCYYVKRQS